MKHLHLALASAFVAFAPIAQAFEFWAVNTSNALVRYNSAAPGTALFSASITGLVGIDGVTADAFGQISDISYVGSTLYGIDGNANLYTLNTATGSATLVSSTFSPAGFDLGLASDPFIPGGGLRVVSSTAENFTAALGGVFTAGTSVFVGAGLGDVNEGASLSFSGLAIDPDFGTGFAFDANLDTLFITNDANFAEFFTVGLLGFDFTAMASIDFLSESMLIAAFSTDSSTSEFYTINALTGAATQVGSFGTGITSIAIPEPSTYAALVGLAGLALAATSRRRRVTA